MSNTIILPVVMALPFLSHCIFALKNLVILFGMNPVVWLRNSLKEVIRTRKLMGPNSHIIDLVQLMLFPDITSQHSACANLHSAMTEREIVAQSLTFLLAGYETTSAVLAFFCHELSRHPDVQQRLYQEIEENIGKNEVDYQGIQCLPYFDATFNEICRLYPTASFIVTRQAAESRQFGKLHIPAGMNVLANVWALHRDPAFWEEPESFNPDRFMDSCESKRSSYTFIPFGAGPRHCIGMRFATLETKVTLVKFIKHFLLESSSDTKEELKLIARGAIVPEDCVNVKISKRENVPRRRTTRAA